VAEPSNADIRAWGRANGYAIADRGRIPAAAVAAFAAAHPSPPPADEGGGADASSIEAPPLDGTEAEASPEVPRSWDRSADRPSQPAEDAPWAVAPGQPAAPETPSWARPTGPPPGWGSAPPPPAAGWPAPPAGQVPPGGSWDPGPPKAPGRDTFSIVALVFGIFPLFGGILGIVFGAVALGQIRRSGRRGRGMAIAGIVLGTCWLLLIGVAVLVSITGQADRAADGSVSSSGTVTTSGLLVGDCAGSLPEDRVRTIPLVPCREPHRGEVFAVFPLSGSTYPGEADARRFAKGGCFDRVAAYVGPAREAEFNVYYVIPTEASWTAGQKNVHCLLTSPGKAMLPGGSAKLR
jgi:hypothetical protein